MMPIHRLDHQPKISIFLVTRLDIEADLNHIEADLKLADCNVTVVVTVMIGVRNCSSGPPPRLGQISGSANGKDKIYDQ